MKSFSRALVFLSILLPVLAKAQSGIGLPPFDATTAFHVKNTPFANPIRLDGLQDDGTNTLTDVVVKDANGVLYYRPITDLTVSGEWEDQVVGGRNMIVAGQALDAGNTISILDNGRVGIGTNNPLSVFHIDTDGDGVTATGGTHFRIGRTASYIAMDGDEIGQFVNNVPSTLFLNSEGGTISLGQNSGNTSRLIVNGRTQVTDLPTGDLDGVGTDDELVTTDAAGNLRKVPAADLIEDNAEWRNDDVNDRIYAYRTDNVAGNDVVITESDGYLGVGTVNPQNDLQVSRGIVIGNDIDGAYSTSEAIRFAGGGTSDGMITTQDGSGRFVFKWNATYGPGEDFLAGNEHAVRMLMHGDETTGAEIFEIESSNSTGAAGDNINWNSRLAIENTGEIGIGTTAPTSRLDVNGTVRVRNLPTGVVSGADPTDDYIVLADRATNELRRISPSALFNDEGEWAYEGGGVNEDRIYARRARDDGSADVVVDEAGRVGIGVRAPRESLHLNGGGMRIDGNDFGIGFNNETPYPGAATRDGSRIYHGAGILPQAWRDFLIIEKTDANHVSEPDGGIAFANRNGANTRYTSMVIRGDGEVGIGRNLVSPLATLHVNGGFLVRDGGAGNNDGSSGLLQVVDYRATPFRTWANRGLSVQDETDYFYVGLKDEGGNREDAVIAWGDNPDEDLRFIKLDGASTETDVMHIDGQYDNVGIGTVPEQNNNIKLDVNGQVRVRDLDPQTTYDPVNNLIVIADGAGRLKTVTNDVFKQDFEDLDWTISGDDIYNSNSRGVGIGVTNGFSAAYKLDVGADSRIRAANRIYFRDTESSIYSSNARNLDLEARNNTTFRRWGGSGANPLTVEHSSRTVGIGVDNPVDGYALEINGLTRIQNQSELRFGGDDDNMIYAASNTDFRITAQELFSVRSRGDGIGILSVKTAGTGDRRVGINTNTPGEGANINSFNEIALDVDGSVRVRRMRASAAADDVVTIDANGELRSRPADDVEGPWVREVTGGGQGEVITRDLSDFVGIGTNAPLSTLHVAEQSGTDALIGRTGSITLTHADAGGESSVLFRSVNSTNDYGYIMYDENGDANSSNTTGENAVLSIGTTNNGSDHIALLPSGNVGINTSSPTADLHVQGTARVTNMTTVNNTSDFAVTVDAAGNLRKQAINVIRDNLGNHDMTTDLVTGGNSIRYSRDDSGPEAGIVLTPQNSVMTSNRLQIGNVINFWVDDAIGGQTNGFAGNDGVIFAPVRDDGTENSDMRVYIMDNNNDAFSFWGNPCGGGNCGSIDAASRNLEIRADGQITIDKLGTGGIDQMVTVDANGVLGSAAIPTGSGSSTADNLGNHIATQNIRLSNSWLTNDGGNRDGLRVSDDGSVFFNTSRVLAWSNNNLWDVFSTRIVGDTDADGQGGNNDLFLVGRDDIVLRSRGGQGDIQIDSDDDVEIRAQDQIRIRAEGTGGSDDIRMYTRNNQERVRIQNDGDVQVFDLAGGGNRVVMADNNGVLYPLAGSADGLWERDAANSETYLANLNDDVGIGTADPEAPLHVRRNSGAVGARLLLDNGNNNGDSEISFRENNRSRGIDLRYDGGDERLYTQSHDGTRLMTIERAGGDVGIGVDNPSAQLHIARSAANGAGAGVTGPARVRIQNPVNNGSAAIELQEGSGGISGSNAMSLRYNGQDNRFEIVDGEADRPTTEVRFSVNRDNGLLTSSNLATGGASEIVVADAAGVLSTQVFDQALWAVDNTDSEIFLDPGVSSFRLGIGTNAPSAKLDVDGTARIRSLGTGAGTDFIVTADANGNLRQLPASDFENYWERDPTGNGTNAYTSTANSDDFVGIGTAAPTSKLDVAGTVRVRSLPTGDVSTDVIVVADASGNFRQIPTSTFDDFWNRNDAGAQDYVELATTTDFVGIGTTTAPTAQFHTTGTVRLAGLTNTGVAAGGVEVVVADLSGNLSTRTLSGNLWSRTGTNTHLANAADFIGVGTSSPTSRFHIASGDVTITDLFGTTGDENADRVVVATAGGVLRSLPVGTLNSPFVVNASNDIQQRDQTLNVGMGINTPDAALHVYRNAPGTSTEIQVHNRSGNGSSQIRFRENLNNEETNSMLLRYDGQRNRMEVTNGWGDATGTVRTDSFATHMVVMRNNGRVGINLGANNPEDQLDVDGNIRIRDGHRIRFNEAQSYIIDATGGNTGNLTMQADQRLLLRGREDLLLRSQAGSIDLDAIGAIVADAATNVTLRANGNDFIIQAADDIFFRTSGATNRAQWHDQGRLQIYSNSNPAVFELDVDGSIRTDGIQIQTGATAGHILQSDANGTGSWIDPSTVFSDDQALTFDPATGLLSLVDGGTPINLANATIIDDQELGWDASTSTLTIDNGNSVILTSLLDDTDDQTLSILGNRISLTDGGFVDLPAATVDTDDQGLLFSSNTITIEDGTGSIDLSPFLDNTDDQGLLFSSNTITIEDGSGSIDLSPYLDNTDAQAISVSSDELSITGNASTVDLSPYLDNTDAQAISLTGTTLEITGNASTVDLSSIGALSGWSKTGSNITLATASDNVGIGVTPAASVRFQVGSGNVRFDVLSGGTNEMVVADANGQLSKQAIPTFTNYLARSGTQTELANTGDNLMIGVGTATAKLHVAGDANIEGLLTITSTGTNDPLRLENLQAYSGGSPYDILVVDADGDVQVHNSVTASDRRLKENIKPMEGTLEKLAGMESVSFNYRQDVEDYAHNLEEGTHYGVIAQQVQEAFPHAVVEKDGYLHIQEKELMGVVISATKELNEKNAELEAANEHLAEQVYHMMMDKADLEKTVHSLRAETSELQTSMAKVLEHLERGKQVQASGN